jgi:hypothetical protein
VVVPISIAEAIGMSIKPIKLQTIAKATQEHFISILFLFVPSLYARSPEQAGRDAIPWAAGHFAS